MRLETLSLPQGKAHYMLMSASEIVGAATQHDKWMRHQMGIQRGNMRDCSVEQFKTLVSQGDENLVKQSEKMLAKIEDQIPLSKGWRNVDDVVGAVPNVPAFLAGHPQCMRRRERSAQSTAPLTVYMDLASSMVIGKDLILQRGVALLALVRLLVAHRPVELWVGTTLGTHGVQATSAWQIDTAPMDLARAAFQIADSTMSRLFGYAMGEAQVGRHLGGFGFAGFSADEAAKPLRTVTGWSEVMYLPPISYSDPLTKDPVGWIRKVMQQYVRDAE